MLRCFIASTASKGALALCTCFLASLVLLSALRPADPRRKAPKPDNAAVVASEAFAGAPRRDDLFALVSGIQPVDDVPSGREVVIPIVDMLEHVADVDFA